MKRLETIRKIMDLQIITDYNSIENRILNKLRGLKILNPKITQTENGPIVTGYALEFNQSTPIANVLKLNEDLALACGVESVDIQRIGNKVWIFVPNEERKVIDFKDALFWYLKDEKVRKAQLPLLLGTDFKGNKQFLELSTQPHLLIAGSTGSGKSIFEANIVASLAMLKDEHDLILYLVDTKRLDLTLFEDLPQVAMIAKDIEDWYLLINSLVGEVSNRNYMFEKCKVRNIQEYNQKQELDSKEKMPYIVLVIDELADLIEHDKDFRKSATKEHLEPKVIDALRRLIQICRASGVHVIACTQRTSVDVITGIVKTNFPTRISLKLPSSTDSRTILDSKGAENLLGKGDMLLKSQDSDNLKRLHSPFVNLEDVKMILEQKEMILNSLGG
jgi:DNA segregation ATPase FtsK/SpoIIIE, S-DNA-T family